MVSPVTIGFCLRAGCALALVCAGLARAAQARAAEEREPSDPASYGIVVDPDGRPVAGAMVIWDARERNLFVDYGNNRIPKTDADGRFELPGGAKVLTVFSLDWQLQSVRIRRPLDEPLKIVMKKGKRVEFRTVDREGRPIAGISFFPQRAHREFFRDLRDAPYYDVLDFLGHRDLIRNQSDANGLFVWENAPDEALGYQIIGSDVLSQPGGEYGPEGSPYTLVFRPRIPVSATVVDAVTGEPIETFEIFQGTQFKANRPGMWDWTSHTPRRRVQIEAGRFSDRLLTLDRLIQYRVQAEGYRPEVSASLDAASLPDKRVVLEFRLQRQSNYHGTLLTPDGAPAGGAEICLKGPRDQQGRKTDLRWGAIRVVDGEADPITVTSSTTAAADGKFSVALDNDPFVCFIAHESGYAAMMDVDLFVKPEHTLIPWATIRGELFVNGEPAPNVSISGFQLGWIENRQKAITDATGKYEFTRCIAGRIDERIQYDTPRYLHDLVLDLAPGRTVVQRLGAEGTNLVGRLRLPPGWAVARDRSDMRLVQLKEQPPPRDGKPRLSGTQQVLRSVHQRAPAADDSFRFFNLVPVEHELSIALLLEGPDGSEVVWLKVLQITPEMFVGKGRRTPIDLGEIPVEHEK